LLNNRKWIKKLKDTLMQHPFFGTFEAGRGVWAT